MAQIEKRQYEGGKTTRWRVKWRVGGNGEWEGQQFDRNGDACDFKALVDAKDPTFCSTSSPAAPVVVAVPA